MKIGGIKAQSLYTNYNKVKESNRMKSIYSKDKIEISDEAKKLRNYDSLGNIDNSKKIEDLKNKIKNGTYKVDSRLTAESIISNIIKDRS